jgi:hypothetical protein
MDCIRWPSPALRRSNNGRVLQCSRPPCLLGGVVWRQAGKRPASVRPRTPGVLVSAGRTHRPPGKLCLGLPATAPRSLARPVCFIPMRFDSGFWEARGSPVGGASGSRSHFGGLPERLSRNSILPGRKSPPSTCNLPKNRTKTGLWVTGDGGEGSDDGVRETISGQPLRSRRAIHEQFSITGECFGQ